MNKEPVTKFNLEAAFRALDELEVPVAEKGIRPNKVNLQETFTKKLKTESLLEDYYDVSNPEDLEQAKEDREEAVAKAKLARIEKIVDLDAKSPEDLQPTYVGKDIIQCPQCMTLFYKNPEDIEASEEDPETVNVGEVCQHCGNDSGYTLVGKVGETEPEEQEMPAPEENELNLDFEEPKEEEPTAASEEETEETSEEPTAEEGEDLNLEPVEDEAKEEEKTEESLNKAEAAKLEHDPENKTENIPLNEKVEEVKPELSEAKIADFEATFKDKEFSTPVTDAEIQAVFDSLPESVNTPAKPEQDTENHSEETTLNESKGDKYIIYGTNSKGDVIHKEDYADKTGKVEDLKKARDLVLDKNENITTAYVSVIKDGKEEPVDIYTAVKKGHEFDTVPEDTVEESLHKAENTAETAVLEHEPENKTLNEETIEIKVEVQPGAAININEPKVEVEKEEKPIEPTVAAIPEVAPVEIPAEMQAPVAAPEIVPEIDVAPAVMDEPIVVEAPAEPTAAEKVNEIVKEFSAEEAEQKEEADEAEDEEEFEDGVKADDLDEIDETLLNKHITESLLGVYENVDSFKATSCALDKNTLIIEGTINFKSGKTLDMSYTFSKSAKTKTGVVLAGLNESLDKGGEFKLACAVEAGGKKFIPEGFAYKYHVNDILVEGNTKK